MTTPTTPQDPKIKKKHQKPEAPIPISQSPRPPGRPTRRCPSVAPASRRSFPRSSASPRKHKGAWSLSGFGFRVWGFGFSTCVLLVGRRMPTHTSESEFSNTEPVTAQPRKKTATPPKGLSLWGLGLGPNQPLKKGRQQKLRHWSTTDDRTSKTFHKNSEFPAPASACVACEIHPFSRADMLNPLARHLAGGEGHGIPAADLEALVMRPERP